MNETISPPTRDPAKARAARTRIKHERWAAEMRDAGWTVTEPTK